MNTGSPGTPGQNISLSEQLTIMDKIKSFIKQEAVLCLATLLAAVSSFWQTPKIEYIDFGVLSILLSLMLVVAGLKSIRFLDWLAVLLLNRCRSQRQVTVALLTVTYISSMFVTNDVALITFVPLAIVIGRTIEMDMSRTIILQTLAANLGSMATPPGNPQNLFLYAFFDYDLVGFFQAMLPSTLLAIVFLLGLSFRTKSRSLELALPEPEQPERGKTIMYLALLLLNIGAVIHFVDKYIALAITVVFFAVTKRMLFRVVDYSLLVTFVGFFIFIGNISHTDVVEMIRTGLLSGQGGTYLAGLGLSQVVSNVPAAMLLAGLTDRANADALLVGVNVGGMGTLIASMASVISFKLFVLEHPAQAGAYMRMFTYYNVIGLALIGALTYYLQFFPGI